MNNNKILSWLVSEAAENAGRYNVKKKSDLEWALREINNRRELELPGGLQKDKNKMIRALRKHFKDDVSFISLVLNHYFPRDFLFYRVSQLEEEILEGMDFLGFELPFDRIGKKGFDRYLILNNKLLRFANKQWPNIKNPQKRIHYFLYQGLGNLFVERSNYSRYWVLTTTETYFDALDEDDEVSWSGRKEMKAGDLAFIYRMAPTKAITELWKVEEDPVFNPWGAWGGWYVSLKYMVRIKDIPFSVMRQDSVLKNWSVIGRQFQGVVAELIPYSIYNRLLNMLSDNAKKKCGLESEQVLESEYSGKFASESQFDEDFIIPLIEKWDFKYQRQHPVTFCVGTQYHHCRVDFLVSDQRGLLTLFENKFRIMNEKDLKVAVDQAKSYALLLALPSFVVASPEGIWVYKLNDGQVVLVTHFQTDKVEGRNEEMRKMLIDLRG